MSIRIFMARLRMKYLGSKGSIYKIQCPRCYRYLKLNQEGGVASNNIVSSIFLGRCKKCNLLWSIVCRRTEIL